MCKQYKVHTFVIDPTHSMTKQSLNCNYSVSQANASQLCNDALLGGRKHVIVDAHKVYSCAYAQLHLAGMNG